MAQKVICFKNTWIEFVLFCVICVVSLTFADSHEDNKQRGYKTVYVEDRKICKLNNEVGTLKLGPGQASSVIVTTDHFFGNWSGKYSLTCNFVVKAPPDYGLFAVIQTLNLRKHESNGLCMDYVKLKGWVTLGWLTGKNSPEQYYCGQIHASQGDVDSDKCETAGPDNEIGPNTYTAESGQINVVLHRSATQPKPNEKLDFRIAFTAYKDVCSDTLFNCGRCYSIWHGFVEDKVQNCPCLLGEGCPDEGGCNNLEGPNGSNKFSSGTGTKVTVSVVIVILIVLLSCGIFFCICRKTRRCCWQANGGGSGSRMEMHRPQASQQRPTDPLAGGHAPNTPMGTAPSAPPEPDIKDVPPSYESLFPTS